MEEKRLSEERRLLKVLKTQVDKYFFLPDSPVGSGNFSESKRIEKELRERVFGQDRAIRRIVRAVSIFEAKLNDSKRPIGCWILAGPSGVGKTFTAKEFGHIWIGEPEGEFDPVVLVSCGNLTLEHQVTSLTGAPPSYVGYNDEPILADVGAYDEYKKSAELFYGRLNTWWEGKDLKKMMMLNNMGNLNQQVIEFLNNKGNEEIVNKQLNQMLHKKIDELYEEFRESLRPFRSVVIFDEFEKAHPNIQKEILNILEEGNLRLQNGVIVDFTGSIIFLTTNLGTPQITQEYLDSGIGFHPSIKKTKDKKDVNLDIYNTVCKEIEKEFPPELLSRVGGRKGIIVFHFLQREHYLRIIDRELDKIQNMLSGKPNLGPGAPVLLSFSPELKNFLLKKSESPKYGARTLRDVIDKHIKEPLARKIISGEVQMKDGVFFTVKASSGKIGEEKEPEEEVVIEVQRKIPNLILPRIKLRKAGESPIKIEARMKNIIDEIRDELLNSIMNSTTIKPSKN